MGYFSHKLQQIKQQTASSILPYADRVPDKFYPTITAFPLSYSLGRGVLEVAQRLAGSNQESIRILIIGAAFGRDYSWLAGSGFKVDILDLGVHEWAESSYVGDVSSDVTWQQFNVKYDLIVLCDVLEHLVEDFKALVNIRNYLAKAGVLYLTVPFNHDPEPTHVRSYTLITLERLLQCAGFIVSKKRLRPGPFEVFPWLTIAANYGMALLMPNVDTGAILLNKMLDFQYELNLRFSDVFARCVPSVQYGVVLEAISCEQIDHLSTNKTKFVTERANS
jgi:hypothetical protein